MSFLVLAQGLMKVKCGACNGWGHTDRKCPTLARLRSVTNGHELTKSWLNTALRKTAPNLARKGMDPLTYTTIRYPKSTKD